MHEPLVRSDGRDWAPGIVSLKIDVTDIVRDHVETLVDGNSGRTSRSDLVLFILIPAVVAGMLAFARIELSPNAANVMITALAIFTGLLFNLLLLAHSIIRHPEDGRSAARTERRLLREIYINIAFAILVALAAIVLLVMWMLNVGTAINAILAIVTYALLVNFLMTLLMVLKRIHVMLSCEFV